MGKFDKLYARLPIWAQHGAVTTYGAYRYWLRFGSGYRHYVQEFTKRESYSVKQWQVWQTQQLQQLLKVAAEQVPYYRENWREGMKTAVLAGNLQGLPLLEKEPVRANPKAFLRQDIKSEPPVVFHTSGSTGTPISTMWTVPEVRKSLALREVRSARWAGTSFALPRATFSGRLVEPNPDSAGPFYRFNWVERQVYFSPFHLRPETAAQYVDALRKHEIQWLTGYAVSYYLLARFIIAQNLQVPSLRAVVTTSEKVTPEMRQVMEAAYQCPVFEEYSSVENVLFASECVQGRLHVSPDVGVVEILDDNGRSCPPGEVGEVVTTGLMRQTQPFIRYRLGDLAMWDTAPCPCGRPMPVIKEVVGRVEDVVVGADGRQMVRFHGIFIDQPNVREGQIIQKSIDRIDVKVVPINGFGPDDVQDIIGRVQQRLGSTVQVTVNTINNIPRNKAGKFQAVVSLLPPDDTDT